MPLPGTESLHPDAVGLDVLDGPAALALLLAGQQAALASLAPALADIDAAARLMADTLKNNGRLIYGGAGSSALMAMADALELPGTYGISPDRIAILMAGGMPGGARMPGHTEDDTAEAARAGEAIARGDLLIVVTASGSTPYALELARVARARGASVIAMANNPGTPILEGADVAVCLATPPELVAGSTRMGAGTAQKAALNLMSTLMAMRIGAVHDGMMVDLVADNAKLRARAARIIARIADVAEPAAMAALDRTGGRVKPAILMALGAPAERVERILDEAHGNLRAAIARIRATTANGENDNQPGRQG